MTVSVLKTSVNNELILCKLQTFYVFFLSVASNVKKKIEGGSFSWSSLLTFIALGADVSHMLFLRLD